eukprot:11112742-Lingulodinium_polyedra.AAC.1
MGRHVLAVPARFRPGAQFREQFGRVGRFGASSCFAAGRKPTITFFDVWNVLTSAIHSWLCLALEAIGLP